MPKIKWLGLATAFILFFTNVQAQIVANIEYAIIGNEIVITYDLQGQSSEAQCEVSFYYGNKVEQRSKLVNARGDIGSNVRVGNEKIIRSSDLLVFDAYGTDLMFRGQAIYTFIPITNLTKLNGQRFKTGSSIPLTWTGGIENSPISLGLYKHDEPVSKQPILFNNNNEYEFALPKTVKKGNEYEIMITDTKGITLNTGKFSVKPKISGAVKVVVSVAIVGVVGGGIYMLTKGGNETPTTTPETTGMPELPEGAFPTE